MQVAIARVAYEHLLAAWQARYEMTGDAEGNHRRASGLAIWYKAEVLPLALLGGNTEPPQAADGGHLAQFLA
eukprot:3565029-Prymnesium_polylepis.2